MRPCSPVVATQQPAIPVPACSVWPNPASGQLHFSLSGTAIRSIALMDAYGRVARQELLSGGRDAYTMSLEGVPAGVYFWWVEGVNGKKSVGKVVVRHR